MKGNRKIKTAISGGICLLYALFIMDYIIYSDYVVADVSMIKFLFGAPFGYGILGLLMCDVAIRAGNIGAIKKIYLLVGIILSSILAFCKVIYIYMTLPVNSVWFCRKEAVFSCVLGIFLRLLINSIVIKRREAKRNKARENWIKLNI